MNRLIKSGITLASIYGLFSYYKYRKDYPPIKALINKPYDIEIEKNYLNIKDRNIYYEYIKPRIDNNDKPLLLCVHGFDSSSRFMKRLCALALAKSGFEALVFDFCGGGLNSKSDLTMKDMTILSEKEELNMMIDYALNINKRIILIGESMGSLLSAIVAKEREEDIEGIILYYPAFSLPDTIRSLYPDKENIEEDPKLFGISLSKEFFLALYDMDTYELCKGYKKKVLLLHGDNDEIVNVEYARKAKDIYPNIKYIELANEIHNFRAKGKILALKEVYDFLQ